MDDVNGITSVTSARLQGPRYPLVWCAGGTPPRMEVLESSLEHDHMDVEGRVAPGAATERPRTTQDEYRTSSGENVGNIFSR